MAISQPFSGKLCWMADINYPQKKKFYVEVRWLPQRVTFGWSYQQMGDWWTIRMVIFFCFFPFIQMEFLCMVELWKRTDNISGSWGFKWNWYLCYSNSKTHRSKGICYSRFAITNLPHLMAPIPCLHMFSTIFSTRKWGKIICLQGSWSRCVHQLQDWRLCCTGEGGNRWERYVLWHFNYNLNWGWNCFFCTKSTIMECLKR